MATSGDQSPPRHRRVLFIVENLPVPFDQRVWNEATTLRARGYEITVICPKGKGHETAYEVIDGIHIFRHPLPLEARSVLAYPLEYLGALFWEFILAWWVFFQRGFDVIHACNPPDTIFLVAAVFKVLFGKRFLFDHHDLCPELYEAKFNRRGPIFRVLIALEKLTYKLADVSIATNNSYRQVAIDRGGMQPDRVYVVRSGPSLDRIRILPPVDKLRNGRRYLVGYVGVMGNEEGIEYLLQAASHIVHKLGRTDVQFGIVGDGTEFARLNRMAEEMGLGDCATFTGRVPDQQLLEMLNTADVCVGTDGYNEMNDKSTMNKILEYMAVGKPIVQFDLTEGRISAQDASLYAKPNDPVDLAEKILELLDDPVRRARMGEFGRKRIIDKLAWTHEAPKLLAAYESLSE